MIDLESVGHIPDSFPAKIVHVGDDNDLVAPLDQALSELVAMSLHSSEFGSHEVGTNADAIFGGAFHKFFYVLVIILVKVVMPLNGLLLQRVICKGLAHLRQHVFIPHMPFHVR